MWEAADPMEDAAAATAATAAMVMALVLMVEPTALSLATAMKVIAAATAAVTEESARCPSVSPVGMMAAMKVEAAVAVETTVAAHGRLTPTPMPYRLHRELALVLGSLPVCRRSLS